MGRKEDESGAILVERTNTFFAQDIESLTAELKDRALAVLGTDSRVQVTKATAFKTEANGGIYKPVQNMEPGTLWVLRPNYSPKARILLIAALEDGQKGACIKIEEAKPIDTAGNLGANFRNLTAIATHLGLEAGERAPLRFLDGSATLYIARSSLVSPQLPTA